MILLKHAVLSVNVFIGSLLRARNAFCTSANFKCKFFHWLHICVSQYDGNLLYSSSIQHSSNHLDDTIYVCCNAWVTAYLNAKQDMEVSAQKLTGSQLHIHLYIFNWLFFLCSKVHYNTSNLSQPWYPLN